MRICTVCKKEKPPNEYSNDKRTKLDGKQSVCKVCRRKKERARRENPKFRSKILKQKLQYQRTVTGRKKHNIANSKYSKTLKGKRAQYKKHKKRDQLYPEKKKAHEALHHAVKIGKIIRPIYCISCNKPHDRIEGHHYKGYDKEHWLDVLWLCQVCHLKLHNLYHTRIYRHS